MDLNPLSSVVSLANSLLDRFVQDPTKKAEMAQEVLKMQLNGELQQMADQAKINLAEASSPNWFVAAWRPAVGWVCVLGLSLSVIVFPLSSYVLTANGHPTPMPVLDQQLLQTLLFSLLGMGTMRTVEKLKDAQGNH